jgi:hypothetical protein
MISAGFLSQRVLVRSHDDGAITMRHKVISERLLTSFSLANSSALLLGCGKYYTDHNQVLFQDIYVSM